MTVLSRLGTSILNNSPLTVRCFCLVSSGSLLFLQKTTGKMHGVVVVVDEGAVMAARTGAETPLPSRTMETVGTMACVEGAMASGSGAVVRTVDMDVITTSRHMEATVVLSRATAVRTNSPTSNSRTKTDMEHEVSPSSTGALTLTTTVDAVGSHMGTHTIADLATTGRTTTTAMVVEGMEGTVAEDTAVVTVGAVEDMEDMAETQEDMEMQEDTADTVVVSKAVVTMEVRTDMTIAVAIIVTVEAGARAVKVDDGRCTQNLWCCGLR